MYYILGFIGRALRAQTYIFYRDFAWNAWTAAFSHLSARKSSLLCWLTWGARTSCKAFLPALGYRLVPRHRFYSDEGQQSFFHRCGPIICRELWASSSPSSMCSDSGCLLSGTTFPVCPHLRNGTFHPSAFSTLLIILSLPDDPLGM